MPPIRIPHWLKSWNWPLFWRGLGAALLLGLFLVAVRGPRPDPTSTDTQALGLARNYLFDFVDWEVGALLDKVANDTIGPQRYMTEDERVQYVRDYFKLVDDIARLEQQVEDIYVDPNVQDPAAASADLRAERDALRAEQQPRQALAEAIIQSQVSEMLAEYGFNVGGEVLPPVEIRFTQLPTVLIVSRRDRIERVGTYALEHGLTVEQMQTLESSVDQKLGVSSLVVPIGGLAMYPSMLIETGYLPHAYEITAHEWFHHYLSFFPLGFNYGVTPELYTMNETAANIVGQEIGWAVLNRYYPDLAGPPPDWSPQPPPEQQPTTPQGRFTFDFREQMHITRVAVDQMLAAGRIQEAEAYMEYRRRIFVKNGYSIRKLNQAYFAFYGSYAEEPGATGADPVGPALRELRYYSPSLLDFVLRVREMTSLAQLQAAVEQARQAHDAGK